MTSGNKTSGLGSLAGLFSCGALILVCLIALLPLRLAAEGKWISLNNQPTNGVGTMLLLSDGTVMAQNGQGGNQWFSLTPDNTGGYTNGQWANRASMTYTREYYSSDVLQDGKVFICGAEYGNGTTNAEVYDPRTDSWVIYDVLAGIITTNNKVNTNTGANSAGFIDSGSVVLDNGNVLILPVSPFSRGLTAIVDVSNNTWGTAKIQNGNSEDEASTVKLPDNSILVTDSGAQTSERYIPSSNEWIDDADVPVDLFDVYGREEGAGFLLPNGNVFFIGSSPQTAVYQPSGNTEPGKWVQGPAIPNNYGAPDAPAAMMNNGKILCELSPTPFVNAKGSNIVFTTPSYFYEYNYNSGPSSSLGPIGSFTQIHAPNGSFTNAGPTYHGRMLDLPDGTILFTDGSTMSVYIPDGSPLAAGQPDIYSVSWNSDASITVSGTLFNGISQGAGYGDDAQMDSNYPLARFTDGRGQVSYGTTYNWTSTGVQTGSAVVSVNVTLPDEILNGEGGTFSLQIVVNGNPSGVWTLISPVWLDFNYTSSKGLYFGTYSNPYNNLNTAVSAVPNNGTLDIKAIIQPSQGGGSITISKPMTIVSVDGPTTIQ